MMTSPLMASTPIAPKISGGLDHDEMVYNAEAIDALREKSRLDTNAKLSKKQDKGTNWVLTEDGLVQTHPNFHTSKIDAVGLTLSNTVDAVSLAMTQWGITQVVPSLNLGWSINQYGYQHKLGKYIFSMWDSGIAIAGDVPSIMINDKTYELDDFLNKKETDPTIYQWAKEPEKPVYDWSQIENRPRAFTPIAHNHTIGSIDNLQDSLDRKLEHGNTIGSAKLIVVGQATSPKSNIDNQFSTFGINEVIGGGTIQIPIPKPDPDPDPIPKTETSYLGLGTNASVFEQTDVPFEWNTTDFGAGFFYDPVRDEAGIKIVWLRNGMMPGFESTERYVKITQTGIRTSHGNYTFSGKHTIGEETLIRRKDLRAEIDSFARQPMEPVFAVNEKNYVMRWSTELNTLVLEVQP